MKSIICRYLSGAIATLLLLSAISVLPPKVNATSALLYVDPPEIIDSTMIPCVSNFDINISVADIANMKTCQFNLTYDSTVITFIRLTLRMVNGQFPAPNMDINDEAGYIWMKLTYTSAVTISTPTPLVTITFHLKSLGASPLHLTDTLITDLDGNPIPHDVHDGFFVAQIRDVAITNVAASRTWAYAGWPVNVSVAVKNNGNASETFDLHAYYNTNLIGTTTVANLTPNEQREILFQWDTTGVAEGNYTISATADAVQYESNLADNTLTDGKIWILSAAPGEIHDVEVYSVALTRNWVYKGWIALINVTVHNAGGFNETFDVKAYYNETFLIGTVHVDNLGPSEFFTAQFSLNTSTLEPCHTYPISGVTTPIPYEYNMANNVLVDGGLKVRAVGDINGDGQVDIADVYAVSLAYGSFPGHPRWNPDADLNQDLMIDLVDIYTVSRNFGTICNP